MTIDEFKQADLRAAKVVSAERVEGSEKLLKLVVDIGSDPSADSGRDLRQILSGIGKWYTPELLAGKTVVVIANLDPRQFKIKVDDPSTGSGQVVLESRGMLLAAAGDDGVPVFLTAEKEVPPGARVS